MADIDGLIELAQEGFIPDAGPDAGQELHKTLEGLPELFTYLRDGLSALADWIPEQNGGDQTGERVNDMATHIGAVHEAATQAFTEFQNENPLWAGS